MVKSSVFQHQGVHFSALQAFETCFNQASLNEGSTSPHLQNENVTHRQHSISVQRNPFNLLSPNPSLFPHFVSLIWQKWSPEDPFLYTSVHGKGNFSLSLLCPAINQTNPTKGSQAQKIQFPYPAAFSTLVARVVSWCLCLFKQKISQWHKPLLSATSSRSRSPNAFKSQVRETEHTQHTTAQGKQW